MSVNNPCVSTKRLSVNRNAASPESNWTIGEQNSVASSSRQCKLGYFPQVKFPVYKFQKPISVHAIKDCIGLMRQKVASSTRKVAFYGWTSSPVKKWSNERVINEELNNDL